MGGKGENTMIKDKKWIWCMDYCKQKGWPPAENWAWDKAVEVYNTIHVNTNFASQTFTGNITKDFNNKL